MGGVKSKFLQLRVSPAEKAAIRRAATLARMDMSEWLLSQVLPLQQQRFSALVAKLARSDQPAYLLAELNDWLSRLTGSDFERAVAVRPSESPDHYLNNYVAAMIETAAHRKNVAPPRWTADVAPLPKPAFGSAMLGLRLHLLANAPPPFRRRNIFIDATVGDRV